MTDTNKGNLWNKKCYCCGLPYNEHSHTKLKLCIDIFRIECAVDNTSEEM